MELIGEIKIGSSNITQEQYDSILNYLQLLEKGCDGLMHRSNKYNDNE
jgi:hypothetical protein